MKVKCKSKILGFIIAFLIGVFLASILSYCLVKIFSRVPLEILDMNMQKVMENITLNQAGRELFILILLAFMLLMIVSVFKVFDLDNYLSKTYTVTPNIKIPIPIGKNQTQHGSVWWLNKKELYKKPYGVNTFDPSNPVIHDLLEFSEKQREIEKIKIDRLEKINNLIESKNISFAEAEKEISISTLPDIKLTNEQKANLQTSIFKEGGICVGKRDRNVFSPVKIKLFRKNSIFFYKKKKSRGYFLY